MHERHLLSVGLVVVVAEAVVLVVAMGVYRLVDVAQLPVHLQRATPRAAPVASSASPSFAVPAPPPRQTAPSGTVGDGGVGVERGQQVLEVRVLAGQEAGEATACAEAVLLLVRRLGVHRASHDLRVRGRGVVRVTQGLRVGVVVGGVDQAGVAVVAEGV